MALRQRPEWSGPPVFPCRGVRSRPRGPVPSCAPEGGFSGCRGGRTERSSRRLYLFIYWLINLFCIHVLLRKSSVSLVCVFPLAKELLSSTVSSAPCVSCACFKCERIRCGFGVPGRKRASGRTTRPNLRARSITSVIVRTCKMCRFIRYSACFTLLFLGLCLSNCLRHRRACSSTLVIAHCKPGTVLCCMSFWMGKCQITML